MKRIVVPRLGADCAWRDAARSCISAGIAPQDVTFSDSPTGAGLFDEDTGPPETGSRVVTVPKSFLSLANSVVWHSDADRFDRLYACLVRLQTSRGLMQDRADPLVQSLRAMEKAVHRCQHKMKAFVRFREIGDPAATRRSFAAWFEPTHRTVEPTAHFFAKRFGDMDWWIITPDVSAFFERGALRFELDMPRPDIPDDAHEDLWTTYFCNIFNPARLKVSAMTSEMPKKYWKNLPEAASIAKLIEQAPARARAMAQAAPTLPPLRAARVQAAAEFGTHWEGPSGAFGTALSACTRCPLHASATQVVAGQGPDGADIMIIGEQPGDREDLEGAPFVGPAGQVLMAALAQAGLSRDGVYLTNAVKHFKHQVRGKRRIHKTPNVQEVEQCRFWLDAEIARVRPKIIIALGATAAMAVTGQKGAIAARRGTCEPSRSGIETVITYHPAYVLRLPDGPQKEAAQAALRDDLRWANERVLQSSVRILGDRSVGLGGQKEITAGRSCPR